MTNYFPPAAFAFSVRIAGNRADPDSTFQNVSGLDAEREITEAREDGDNRFAHRLPGRATHQNLVMKRDMIPAAAPLFDWCKTTLESDLAARIETRDLTVSLLDQHKKPLMSWSIISAWPVKWEVSPFDSQKSIIVIETLEFAYQHADRLRQPTQRNAL